MNPNLRSSFVFVALLLSSCQGRFPSSPAPLSTQPGPPSVARQFDPTAPFIPGVNFPQALLSLADDDLVPLACTPDYFSWSGRDYEFVDPSTQKRYPLEDSRLEAALESAQQQNPDGTVTSISLCAVADGQPLVFFRAGPCGGGCAGIPTIATVQQDGTLKIVATIQPTGDGAYFACSPLLLSKTGLLFLSCLGEGTAIIRRVNMSNGEVSIILRCTMPPAPSACVTE